MSLRTLSEAIILQSAEDLLSPSHRREGLDFFRGDGFRFCAEMAGMTFDEKLRFLHMLLGCLESGKGMKKCSDDILAGEKSGKFGRAHRSRESAQVAAV